MIIIYLKNKISLERFLHTDNTSKKSVLDLIEVK